MQQDHHILKIEQSFFQQIIDGIKRFEVRKNDRDYKLGDVLVLGERTLMGTSTGRVTHVKITTILIDERFCKKGFVTLGIELVTDSSTLC